MNEISNLRDTIVPNSDQLNSEQLIAAPMTVTVTGVKRGDSEEQPLTIAYQGDDGRPFKPCKTMRKVLIFAWGDDGREWVGRSMTLYCDPEVKFGGVKVGGIRISHMSGIEKDIDLMLTSTRGRKESVKIRKLAVVAAPAPETPWVDSYIEAIVQAGSMDELKAAFVAGADEAKRRKDRPAVDRLTAAKDSRKAMLESEPVAETVAEPVAEKEDVF